MTDNFQAPKDTAVPPSPETKPRPRISIVWLIPIVAVLIGGWLVWKTLSEKGPIITITFSDASGLEPGKTKIKYLDVDVGTIQSVKLTDDLQKITATAEMSKDMDEHLTQTAQFWVVQPRLTASGVSGLGTLLSGAYIGMLPGQPGPPKRSFTALTEPPVIDFNAPGRRFKLKAKRIGSVSAGSSIYYRGIPVGIVLGSELNADKLGVTFFIFIEKPYENLIRDKTRFWNASGVRVEVGSAGVTLQTESLQSVLTGGIAFETPLDASDAAPAAEGTTFTLYPTHDAIKQAEITSRIPYLIEFDGSVRGLAVGAPVDFRGIQIGTVTDIRLVLDPERHSFKIPVVIHLEPQRAKIEGGLKDVKPYDFMRMLIKQGLRAQLTPGSLITGQLIIALDFFPDAKPAELKMGGEYPEIPTVPSNIEVLSAKAKEFLDKLAALPLPQLIEEVRRTVRDADKLLSVQGTKAAQNLQPLLISLKQTSDEANAMLRQLDTTLKSVNGMVGDDSHLRYQLTRMIEELTQTARALRSVGNTIDRQPQSIIFGKEGKSAP